MNYAHGFLLTLLSVSIYTGYQTDNVVAQTSPVYKMKKGNTNGPVVIRVGRRIFTATILDNPTAKAFKNRLPLTLPMKELNGNEKYGELSSSLPTSAVHPDTIQSGDLMLYGSETVVLFYESFRTSYSYTRLGRIDNPAGLATALGAGNVTISFELA